MSNDALSNDDVVVAQRIVAHADISCGV